MAEIVKVKVVKRECNKFAKYFLLAALFLSIFTNLFIKSLNNRLAVMIENTNAEAAVLRKENSKLTAAIQTLSCKERVYEVAKEFALSAKDNVKNVIRGE